VARDPPPRPTAPSTELGRDKLLFRLGRDEAIALPADVSDPVLLVSGVWSNKLGEPLAGAWLAAAVEDAWSSSRTLHGALASAGVAHGMVNPAWSGDLDATRALIEPVVVAAEARLTDDLLDQLAPIEERLNATRQRLASWQQEATATAMGIGSRAIAAGACKTSSAARSR